jgi:hypothetical protein
MFILQDIYFTLVELDEEVIYPDGSMVIDITHKKSYKLNYKLSYFFKKYSIFTIIMMF